MYVAQLIQRISTVTLLVTVQQYTNNIDKKILGHPAGGHITEI
jgi:hypothetical protein